MEMLLGAELPVAGAPADREERDLVARSVSGDGQAFEALVRRHERRVFRLAGRFFHTREDIEDAAQETFLTAWRRLGTYRARAPFEHWLTRVCLNTCYRRVKGVKPTVELQEWDAAVAGPDPDARLEVERLLARLPAHDRFILLLLDGEGWSVREIAERLGWTAVNVKVRAHRARRRLARILEAGE